MKLLREIKEFMPSIDVSMLSNKEFIAWQKSDFNVKIENNSIFEKRAAKKLVSQLVDNISISEYDRACKEVFDSYAKFYSVSLSPDLMGVAVFLANDIEKNAKRIGLPHIAASCAEYILTYHYNKLELHKARLAEVRQKEHLKVIDWEAKVRRWYHQMHYLTINKTVPSKKTKEKITIWANKLEPMISVVHTPKFQLQARLIILTSINSDEDRLSYSKKSYDYFTSLGFDFQPGIIAFGMLICQLLTKADDLNQSIRLLNDVITKKKNHDHNYYRLIESRIRLEIKSLNHVAAEKSIDYLVQRRSRLNESIKNRLQFYKIYLAILKADIKNIRIKKIINNLEAFHNDKSGMNLSLVIIELLLNLLRQNLDFAIDNRDAIRQYVQRHKLNFTREAAFIKLLLATPTLVSARSKSKFDEIIKKHTLDMNSSPNIANHLEVISYEYLWDSVLKTFISEKNTVNLNRSDSQATG